MTNPESGPNDNEPDLTDEQLPPEPSPIDFPNPEPPSADANDYLGKIQETFGAGEYEVRFQSTVMGKFNHDTKELRHVRDGKEENARDILEKNGDSSLMAEFEQRVEHLANDGTAFAARLDVEKGELEITGYLVLGEEVHTFVVVKKLEEKELAELTISPLSDDNDPLPISQPKVETEKAAPRVINLDSFLPKFQVLQKDKTAASIFTFLPAADAKKEQVQEAKPQISMTDYFLGGSGVMKVSPIQEIIKYSDPKKNMTAEEYSEPEGLVGAGIIKTSNESRSPNIFKQVETSGLTIIEQSPVPASNDGTLKIAAAIFRVPEVGKEAINVELANLRTIETLKKPPTEKSVIANLKVVKIQQGEPKTKKANGNPKPEKSDTPTLGRQPLPQRVRQSNIFGRKVRSFQIVEKNFQIDKPTEQRQRVSSPARLEPAPVKTLSKRIATAKQSIRFSANRENNLAQDLNDRATLRQPEIGKLEEHKIDRQATQPSRSESIIPTRHQEKPKSAVLSNERNKQNPASTEIVPKTLSAEQKGITSLEPIVVADKPVVTEALDGNEAQIQFSTYKTGERSGLTQTAALSEKNQLVTVAVEKPAPVIKIQTIITHRDRLQPSLRQNIKPSVPELNNRINRQQTQEKEKIQLQTNLIKPAEKTNPRPKHSPLPARQEPQNPKQIESATIIKENRSTVERITLPAQRTGHRQHQK